MNYLPQFKIYLQSHNYSLATIRNYLADIHRYQEFVNKQIIDKLTDTKGKRSNDFFGAESSESDFTSDEGREHQEKSVASLPNLINLFTNEILKSYILSIQSDPNFRRYLSSLNKFCQFALDQQLITSNPIKKLLQELRSPPKTNLDDLIKQYQSYLTKKNKTPVTIRNYINDIQQYIRFCQNPSVIANAVKQSQWDRHGQSFPRDDASA